MIKLSILIPTVKRHGKYMAYLMPELSKQANQFNGEVEILVDSHETDTLGKKRNRLLDRSKGKYTVFFDVDDIPSPKYIALLMQGIEKDVDCCSLKGIMTTNGTDHHYFEHSIKYPEYKTNNGTQFEFGDIHYERFPNHISTIKASISKAFKFPETSWGEDTDWATQIHNAGVLKTEHYIPEVIYYYRYETNKNIEAMKYSQSDEQLFIEDYFSEYNNGKFIDIGAYDTFSLSNTRALYETGKWSGVFVEPAPTNFNGIFESYKNDDRITVLNISVGAETGEIDFYESNGDAVGTTDFQHMDKWQKAGVNFTKIKVPQVSIVDFMNEYGQDVDFINIDTESTNMVVFRAMPSWVWGTIKMLCIEHDGFQMEIERTLAPYGFDTLYVNGENIILAKQ